MAIILWARQTGQASKAAGKLVLPALKLYDHPMSINKLAR
jgi:hypothetical protein